MPTKSIITAAAIAAIATIGSASAADRFTTLDGVTAVAMSNYDMDAVHGTAAHFFVLTPGGVGSVSNHKVATMHAAGFVANGGGLRKAEDANGPFGIDVCGYRAGCT